MVGRSVACLSLALSLLTAPPAHAAASTSARPTSDTGALAIELRDEAGQLVNTVRVTPWPESAADTYVVRYFPGVTFRQGQAPVRPSAAEMLAPPGYEAPALGVGLEGRSPAGYGWQLLANWSSSPLAAAPDPRLVLHGFWLPHHRWGFDADVGLDPRGSLATELGTSLLLGPDGRPDLRLRIGAGRQEGAGVPGYGYVQVTVTRDVQALGLTTGFTGFTGQDGAALGTLDAWHAWLPWPALRIASNGSVGAGDPRLPAGRRLGLGLVAAGAATADARLATRTEIAAPLLRGLTWGWAPVATLAQLEGALFMEGALARGTTDGHDGARAGVGLQLDLLADTALGMPLTLGVGVAMPVGGPDGAPRFYIGTSGARFPRTP